jgi:TM2 domain-containing membrane protein YozV
VKWPGLSGRKTGVIVMSENMVSSAATMESSEKGFVPTLLLCFFLGFLGVHRFYVGKIGTGILMLITFGGFGIWALIDFVMIAVSAFKDKEGLPIKP